jgi:hypothetical protein
MGKSEQKLMALRQLQELGSHAALDRAEADLITEPFGFKARLHKEKANVHPKGLLIDGAKRGQVFERIGAFDLIDQIAKHEGVNTGWATGRGTRFRQTMANLLVFYGREESDAVTPA